MASGDTLGIFDPKHNEPPVTNPATPDLRNGHSVLDFDTTTQEIAIFKGVMPRHYAGGGITVYVHASLSSAISGTLGWDVTFERVSPLQQDIDSDGWATAQTITAATVPGTSGNVDVLSVAITAGAAGTDGITAGDGFRVRLRRDVANDTAAGDGEFWAMEMKES